MTERVTLTSVIEDLEDSMAHEADQLQRCVLSVAAVLMRIEAELKASRLAHAAREQAEAAAARSMRGGLVARLLGRS